ncbi:hypothetical protein NNO_1264 [Hydrogenimonas sp.]|nr:hypothetical protein NNO_1264 [Hydrogenimonas sp.]
MNETLQKLKDIKPPVEVPDSSLWLFLLLAAATVAVAAALVVWLLGREKRRRRRGAVDPIEEAERVLGKLDFKDAKSAVYTFDEYIPVLAAGDEDIMKEFRELQERLERYKYKREVPPLEKSDIKRMRDIIKRASK